MIRVTVDLIPFGEEKDKKEISVLEIGNEGIVSKLTNETKYSYNGFWFDTENKKHKFYGSVYHDRRNVVWFLIYKVIIKILEPFQYIF